MQLQVIHTPNFVSGLYLVCFWSRFKFLGLSKFLVETWTYSIKWLHLVSWMQCQAHYYHMIRICHIYNCSAIPSVTVVAIKHQENGIRLCRFGHLDKWSNHLVNISVCIHPEGWQAQIDPLGAPSINHNNILFQGNTSNGGPYDHRHSSMLGRSSVFLSLPKLKEQICFILSNIWHCIDFVIQQQFLFYSVVQSVWWTIYFFFSLLPWICQKKLLCFQHWTLLPMQRTSSQVSSKTVQDVCQNQWSLFYRAKRALQAIPNYKLESHDFKSLHLSPNSEFPFQYNILQICLPVHW